MSQIDATLAPLQSGEDAGKIPVDALRQQLAIAKAELEAIEQQISTLNTANSSNVDNIAVLSQQLNTINQTITSIQDALNANGYLTSEDIDVPGGVQGYDQTTLKGNQVGEVIATQYGVLQTLTGGVVDLSEQHHKVSIASGVLTLSISNPTPINLSATTTAFHIYVTHRGSALCSIAYSADFCFDNGAFGAPAIPAAAGLLILGCTYANGKVLVKRIANVPA